MIEIFRKYKIVIFALFVLLFMIAMIMIIQGHLYDPTKPFVGQKLLPPSASYLLGTDHLGRDVLSRLIQGTWTTLGLSIIAVALAIVVGTVLGMLAGYNVIPILTPIILFLGQISIVFPVRFLPLIIVALFGNGVVGMILAMFFALWGQVLWIIYDETKGIKGRNFIKAAYILGATKWKVVRFHVLPHLYPTLLVLGTFSFRMAIGMISTLTFLGVGLQPPTSTWGLMIAEGHPYFMRAWWTIAFPTLALTLSVLVVNGIGHRLEKRYTDPAQKERQGETSGNM